MKKFLLFVLSALCPLAVLAQGGSEALPFVRTDLGPVLSGTAGAAVASTEAGAWSAFRSGAAASVSENLSNVAVQMRLNGSFPGGAAALSLKPMDNLGVAIGLMYQIGDKVGDYRTSDILLAAGAGFNITETLSVGVNARYAKQQLLSNLAYSGLSFDFSVMDRFSDAVSAIAGVSTLGGKVTSTSGNQYSQPANVYTGAELRYDISDGVLSADAMAEYYFSGSYAAALGAAYTYQEKATLRLGYRYASEWCVLPGQFSAGAGYNFGSISLDASFTRISSQNIIALGIGYTIK